MSLTKVNYVDNQTVISAKNLNDIQEAIISLETNTVTETDVNDAIQAAIGDAIGGSY